LVVGAKYINTMRLHEIEIEVSSALYDRGNCVA
jgi:hypothetical protein